MGGALLIMIILVILPGLALFLFSITGKLDTLSTTAKATLWGLFLIGFLGSIIVGLSM